MVQAVQSFDPSASLRTGSLDCAFSPELAEGSECAEKIGPLMVSLSPSSSPASRGRNQRACPGLDPGWGLNILNW
jgi:hypothetical protein